MIFEPQTARAIATGRRDTLRIPAKPGKAGALYAPCQFRPGQEYVIPPVVDDVLRAAIKRGDKPEPPPLGTVRVASIGERRDERTFTATKHERPVALHITTDQAKAEGYDSTEAWLRAWLATHDPRWLHRYANDLAWARSHDRFRSARGRGEARNAEQWILHERYRQRWEGRPVWVVRFELVAEVRYLAQPDPVKAQGDYTRTPSRAIDPLPVVDAAWQAQRSKDALAFCIGRQMARKREAEAKRKESRAPRIAMFRKAA